MGIFDNILGNWIQIIDEKNDLTIESYKYGPGVIEGTTGNHCLIILSQLYCKKLKSFTYVGNMK